MGHIRKITRKSGDIVYQLSVEMPVGADGKRHQKTKCLKGVSRAKAKEELVKMEAAILGGTYLEKEKILLSEYMEEWLALYIKPTLSPTTVQGYVYHWQKYICDKKIGIGHLPVQRLSTPIIQDFINKLSKSLNLSPKTVKDIYLNLRACLNRAEQDGIIQKNPAYYIKLPKRRKPEITVLNEEEIRQMVKCLNAEDNDLKIPVLLALGTGMRRGEVSALRFRDVDYRKKVIHIRNNRVRIGRREVLEKDTKTVNSERSIPISQGMADMIRKEERRWKKGKLKYGKNYNKEGYVCFKWDTGNPWNPDNMTRKFSRFLEKNQIKHISFHALRHCFASMCLKNGMDMLEISKLLGHATPSFTYDTYIHLMKDIDDTVAEVMEEKLFQEVI